MAESKRDYRIGDCSLCRCSVRKKSEAGKEYVRQNGKLVPHEHKKEYRIIKDDPEEDNHREWMYLERSWRHTSGY